MNVFTINEKEYTAKPFTFNAICELEDMGVSLDVAGERPMSLLRAYLSICGNISKEEAGEQIALHVINGGSLDCLGDAITQSMNESDFFRSINKVEEKETTSKKK